MPTYLISFANLLNKGDALMADAVITEISKRVPDARFVFPHGARDVETFAQLDNVSSSVCVESTHAYGKIREKIAWSRGDLNLALARFAPRLAGTLFKQVNFCELDGIFVINGYLLNGRHSLNHLNRLLGYFRNGQKKGIPIIFLPKTFGPFFRSDDIPIVKEIIHYSSLCFSRDRTSTKTLEEIFDSGEKSIIEAPDYTATVEAKYKEENDRFVGGIAMIPNVRMIDKTPADVSGSYVSFFGDLVKLLRRRREKPFIVLHSRKDDRKVAEKIIEFAGEAIPVVEEADHRIIKGIIGRSKFAVSSRLHGIINGLSQGVPVIGTSWSHKYRELYKSYNCPELLIEEPLSVAKASDIITKLCSAQNLETIQGKMLASKVNIVRQNESMWGEIISKLVRA